MQGTIAVAFLLALVGCGASMSDVVRCKLDALEVLPADPMQATVYDAVLIIERLEFCHRAESSGKDGGT